MNKCKIIPVKDGKALSYYEFGSQDGTPVFYFHGSGPMSGLIGKTLGIAAEKNHIRLICPNRPGIGESDNYPNRTIMDYPSDILILADKLKINKFSIISQSGGCAYGFACAYAAPERVLQLSVVSALTPPDMALVNKEVSFKTRLAVSIFKKCPSWLLIKMYDSMYKTIKKNPESFYNKIYKKASEVEKKLLITTDYYTVYTQTVLDALKNGSLATVADIRLCFNPWGFNLNDISVPVQIWHGQDDKSSPVQLVETMQKTLKRCEARYIQGESHMSLMQNYGEDILKVMSVKINSLIQSS